MRRVAAGFLTLFLVFTASMLVPTAGAKAACPVPNQITNGQPADATVIMGNFNAVGNCATATTGSASAGSLAAFSGPSSIAADNLSGDCSTAGSLVLTCTKTNGAPFAYFATGTDAGQLTGTISVNRFDHGNYADGSHFLRGDGVWAIPPGGTGGGTSTPPVIRASNIQSVSSSAFTVTWPAGTVQGDVVIIFGESGWGFSNPSGWVVLDNEAGGYASGVVVAKVMTAADIAAGSATVNTSSAYNGVIAAVTIDGSTMAGVRLPGSFVKNGNNLAAGATINLSSLTPYPTDLTLVFVGVRGTSNITFSSGVTSMSSINAPNASGNLGKFTGALTDLGVGESATSSASGSGYYTAIVSLR